MSIKKLCHIGENENYNFYENDITDMVNEAGKELSLNCYIADRKKSKGFDVKYILKQNNQITYQTASSDELKIFIEVLKERDILDKKND